MAKKGKKGKKKKKSPEELEQERLEREQAIATAMEEHMAGWEATLEKREADEQHHREAAAQRAEADALRIEQDAREQESQLQLAWQSIEEQEAVVAEEKAWSKHLACDNTPDPRDRRALATFLAEIEEEEAEAAAIDPVEQGHSKELDLDRIRRLSVVADLLRGEVADCIERRDRDRLAIASEFYDRVHSMIADRVDSYTSWVLRNTDAYRFERQAGAAATEMRDGALVGSIGFGLWANLAGKTGRIGKMDVPEMGAQVEVPRTVSSLGHCVRLTRMAFDHVAPIAAKAFAAEADEQERRRSPRSSRAASATRSRPGTAQTGATGGGGEEEAKEEDAEDGAEAAAGSSASGGDPLTGVAEAEEEDDEEAAAGAGLGGPEAPAAAGAGDGFDLGVPPAVLGGLGGGGSLSDAGSLRDESHVMAIGDDGDGLGLDSFANAADALRDSVSEAPAAAAPPFDLSLGLLGSTTARGAGYEAGGSKAPVGDVLFLELLGIPQGAKTVKRWAMREGQALESGVVRHPHPMQGQGGAAAAITVAVNVPETVLLPGQTEDASSGDLKLCYWKHETGTWEEEGELADASFDQETRTLSFRTTYMGPLAVVVPRVIDLPYRAWEMRPRASGVDLRILTPRLDLYLSVTAAGCCIAADRATPPPALAHLAAKQLPVGSFFAALERAGVRISPSSADAELLRDKMGKRGLYDKEDALEQRAYRDMALAATAFAFRGSKWNLRDGPRVPGSEYDPDQRAAAAWAAQVEAHQAKVENIETGAFLDNPEGGAAAAGGEDGEDGGAATAAAAAAAEEDGPRPIDSPWLVPLGEKAVARDRVVVLGRECLDHDPASDQHVHPTDWRTVQLLWDEEVGGHVRTALVRVTEEDTWYDGRLTDGAAYRGSLSAALLQRASQEASAVIAASEPELVENVYRALCFTRPVRFF